MVSEQYFGNPKNYNYGKTVMNCLEVCNIKKYKEILGGEYDCSIGDKDVHKTLFYLKNNWKK